MRVIAGSAGSLPLKTVPGQDTRPTTDRIKETLFNVLSPLLADCAFLDLFAGSGAIGIEALSRGASEAVFIEKDRRAAACIQENLIFTKLKERATILTMDVRKGLSSLEGRPPFDVIFMDPPYGKGLGDAALDCLKTSSLCGSRTLVILEEKRMMDLSFAEKLGFHVEQVREYKTNKHIFLRK